MAASPHHSGLVLNKSSALGLLPLGGGDGAARGEGAGAGAGTIGGDGAAVLGAGVELAAGSSVRLPARSSRIGALIVILACVT
jgi:hypothetical protein